MTEFKGVHNDIAAYETFVDNVISIDGRPRSSLCIPPSYENYGDYPIGSLPDECEEVDPPFSSTNHQKAMTALMETMTLIITVGCELRAALRNAKKAEALTQINKLLDAADKMREAAAFALVAGILEGAMSIAGGGLELAGALKGMREMKKSLVAIDWKKFDQDPHGYGAKMMDKLTRQMEGDTNDLKIATGRSLDATPEQIEMARGRVDYHIVQFAQRDYQRLDQISMLFRASSQLCQALGSMLRGIFQFGEKNAEAASQEMQAWATHYQYNAEEMGDLNKEIADLVSTVLNVIKSICNSDSQTVNSILR